MRMIARSEPRLAAISVLALAALFVGPTAIAQSNNLELAPPQAPPPFSTVPVRSALPDWTLNQGPPIDQIAPDHAVITKSGAQSETSIAVDPTNGRHMLAFSNDLASGATAELYESFDGGKTWANAGLGLSPTFCYDPWIDFNSAGDAFVSYECSDQRIGYKKVGQTTWTKTKLTIAGGLPDRDMVVVDTTSTSAFFNSVYIGYDDNGASNSAFVLYSRDGFTGWARSVKINDTSTTIGVNAATGPTGTVYATWEDYTGKKIWSDRSTDGGATWGTDHLVHNYRMNTTSFFVSIPPQPQRGILPFPMTDTAPAGTTFAGRLYVAYTDLAIGGGSNTDIFVRFSDDGGVNWSGESKVNDDTVNAYHFHPQISVAPNGTVGVSFYDTRDDQPANKKTNQYIAFSTNGGVTWSANQKASSVQSDESGFGNSNDYGDYQGIDAAPNSSFVQIWTDSRSGTLAEDVWNTRSRP